MRNTFLLVLGISILNFPVVAIILGMMGLELDAAFVRAYWHSAGMIFGAASMWFFAPTNAEPHS